MSKSRTKSKDSPVFQQAARETPWVSDENQIKALKGRLNFVAPLQGFVLIDPGSQGVALGWDVSGRWPETARAF